MFATKLLFGLLLFVFLSGLSQSESDDDKKLESELDALVEQLNKLSDETEQPSSKGLLKKLKSLRKIFHKNGANVEKGTIKKLKGKFSQILKDETTRSKLVQLLAKRGDRKTLTEEDFSEIKVIVDDFYQRNPETLVEVKTLLKSKKSSGKFIKIIKAIVKLPFKIMKWIYNIIVAFVGEAVGLALLPVGIVCYFVFGLMHIATGMRYDALGDLAQDPFILAFGLSMFSLTPSDMNLMRLFMIGVDKDIASHGHY